MEKEDLIFVGICDLSAHLRGKAFPAGDLESRLRKGMGYTGANIMMSAFGPIYDNPFGTTGDLSLVPDQSTKVDVEFPGSASERFYLADIRTPDGKPWSCCPRSFLRRAVEDLQREAGLQILSAFEQELVYTGVDPAAGTTYGYNSFRHQGAFGEALISAMRRAGVVPDSFLPEYAPGQYEVTVAPTLGIRAADEAVIVREMARGVAFRLGQRAILSPVVDVNGVGNGTHIHFSLRDGDGRSVMYDRSRPYAVSTTAEPFIAGILHHLPAIAALTAPSIVSYFRLRPNRWAPVWANLAERDRGASLRVCAVLDHALENAATQFNLEYRVTDATASPYIALGAIVHAGVDGIRKGMSLPRPLPVTIWEMTEEQRRASGIATLPRSLDEALTTMAESQAVRSWLGPELFEAYVRLKRSEIAALEGLSEEAISSRYAAAY
jgi:glutamine synthetase